MPFTPYHFGISALPGLGSRGRLDIFVLMAANVLVDTEVLADSYFAPGWPVHQLWHFHTLLVGGLVGAALGAIVYGIRPLRRGCQWFNFLLGFSYSPTFISMILSGLVGAWLHVLIDGLFHYDVQVFWPIQDNLLLRWASGIYWLRTCVIYRGIIHICLLGWILSVILTAVFLCRHRLLQKKTQRPD
jgi:hypothetical protein